MSDDIHFSEVDHEPQLTYAQSLALENRDKFFLKQGIYLGLKASAVNEDEVDMFKHGLELGMAARATPDLVDLSDERIERILQNRLKHHGFNH